MAPQEERLLNPREAGKILGMSVYAVRHWLRCGQLPAVKLRTRWKIRQSDLEAFIRELPSFGPAVIPENGGEVPDANRCEHEDETSV
jgi:excisionase family DNA binding protein